MVKNNRRRTTTKKVEIEQNKINKTLCRVVLGCDEYNRSIEL